MKTHEYLIVRHGSNAANQSMCSRAPVAICEATSREEAKSKALAGDVIAATARCLADDSRMVTVYNNQRLEAIPRSAARVSEWNAVCETDASFGD